MKDHNQEQLLKQIGAALDHSVRLIDPETQLQLDAIRSKALAHLRTSSPVDDNEENLLMTARSELDGSVERLDPGIIARLDDARKSALMQANLSSASSGIWRRLVAGFRLPRLAVPVSAFATACVFVTMAALYYQFPGQPASDLAEADILLFASSDDIELYDNLEFYLWLADNGLPN